VELMDQTGEGERLVKTLARMIEEKRVRVRVYSEGGCTPIRFTPW
jgi:hypothetical protein